MIVGAVTFDYKVRANSLVVLERLAEERANDLFGGRPHYVSELSVTRYDGTENFTYEADVQAVAIREVAR
jgi:hypothetical protein